jgi:hypothetical protein
VIAHLVDGEISILQHADDTILFIEHDLEKVRNLKLILSTFDQHLGLKIKWRYPKESCIDWIIFGQDFFSKEIVEKRNIDRLNQGGLGPLGKWLYKLLTEDGMCQTLLKNTKAHVQCPKYIGNLMTCIFWLV